MTDDARSQWESSCIRWLNVSFKALAEHARRMGHGDRGVLMVNVDTANMEHMLAHEPTMPLPETWLPADSFLDAIRGPKGMGPEAPQRWAQMLAVMDPRADVALFLHSTPTSDSQWFFRFLLVTDGNLPVH